MRKVFDMRVINVAEKLTFVNTFDLQAQIDVPTQNLPFAFLVLTCMDDLFVIILLGVLAKLFLELDSFIPQDPPESCPRPPSSPPYFSFAFHVARSFVLV